MKTNTTIDLSALNAEQRAAVEHEGRALLVLAGAGSGKTRVITFRIARLVREGVDPSHILAVTFTNRAAEEMRDRVRRMLHRAGDAARSITLSTFHALGVRILREDGHLVGVRPRFTILDAEDQRQAVRSVLEELDVDPAVMDPGAAAAALSRVKNDGSTPEDLLADARSYADKMLARLLDSYNAHVASLGALDFDDLLRLPVALLAGHPDVRDRWRDRYRHLLVDEYQDSNRIQLKLVKLLAGDGANLAVVGDDDQSIYGWRGACLDNILTFERHFPGATTARLTQNYRSTGRVLALGNAVIRRASQRREKELWTAGEAGPGITLVVCASPRDEAAYVAMEIERLRRDENLPLGEMGVLYRTNGQSRAFEEGLRAAGIPHRVVGGTAFFERREVKDGLAYLRLLANRRDEISLRRALATPSRGIGAVSLSRLSEYAQIRSEPLFYALHRADRVTGVGPRVAHEARRFASLIDDHAADAERGPNLARVAAHLFEAAGLRQAIYDSTAGRRPSAARFRLENLEALVDTVRAYQESVAEPKLEDYLRRVTLDAADRDDDSSDSQRVTLMTLHSAKGLEFRAVFLTGLEEGLLPHKRSMDEAGGDDEERRLLYVGITRARQWLTLTRSRVRTRYDGEHVQEPSRFLEELPEGLFDLLDRSSGAAESTEETTQKGFASLFDALD